GVGQGVQRGGHFRPGLGRVVVADPGLEQVAEDVQRVGARSLAAQEAQEQGGDFRPGRIQVQVGDEQGGHRRIVGRAAPSRPCPAPGGRRPRRWPGGAWVTQCRREWPLVTSLQFQAVVHAPPVHRDGRGHMTAAGVDVSPTPTSHSGQRKHVALALLAGVALTLGAIAGYDLIPPVRFDVTRVPKDATVLSSTPVPGRAEAGEWLDAGKRRLRCHYPPGTNDPLYYCAVNYFIGSGPDRGLDLSKYTHVELKVVYKGDVPKLRLFARHFDPRYSTVGDTNSTKYNA